eukprot:COSAG01_NODE_13411_length_1589_cov_1.251007_1_plen_398_part_00
MSLDAVRSAWSQLIMTELSGGHTVEAAAAMEVEAAADAARRLRSGGSSLRVPRAPPAAALRAASAMGGGTFQALVGLEGRLSACRADVSRAEEVVEAARVDARASEEMFAAEKDEFIGQAIESFLRLRQAFHSCHQSRATLRVLLRMVEPRVAEMEQWCQATELRCSEARHCLAAAPGTPTRATAAMPSGGTPRQASEDVHGSVEALELPLQLQAVGAAVNSTDLRHHDEMIERLVAGSRQQQQQSSTPSSPSASTPPAQESGGLSGEDAGSLRPKAEPAQRGDTAVRRTEHVAEGWSTSARKRAREDEGPGEEETEPVARPPLAAAAALPPVPAAVLGPVSSNQPSPRRIASGDVASPTAECRKRRRLGPSSARKTERHRARVTPEGHREEGCAIQ